MAVFQPDIRPARTLGAPLRAVRVLTRPRQARVERVLFSAVAGNTFTRDELVAAFAEFEKTAEFETPNYNLLVDWGLAYDGLNQPDKALEKLRQAAAIEPTAHIYTQIGYIYAKRSQWTEAMQAFNTAEKLDPRLAITYMYKGQVYLATNQAAAAVTEFEHALALDFRLGVAQEGLATARQRLSGR